MCTRSTSIQSTQCTYHTNENQPNVPPSTGSIWGKQIEAATLKGFTTFSGTFAGYFSHIALGTNPYSTNDNPIEDIEWRLRASAIVASSALAGAIVGYGIGKLAVAIGKFGVRVVTRVAADCRSQLSHWRVKGPHSINPDPEKPTEKTPLILNSA